MADQPPLPDNAHCYKCERKLDMTHGAAHWRGKWWCLPCFVRGKQP